MKILILYRYHSNFKNDERIRFLLHFWDIYKDYVTEASCEAKFFLILDNMQEDVIAEIMSYFTEEAPIVVRTESKKDSQLFDPGHYTLFKTSAEIAKKEADENTFLFFHEDDYIYDENCLKKSIEFLKRHPTDFLALQDHPNRYKADESLHPLHRPYKLDLEFIANHHWRTTISTCFSFCCHYEALKLLDESDLDAIEGKVSFLNAQRQIFDHSMWCAIWRLGKQKLWGPIPGLSTHRLGFKLDDGIDWDRKLKHKLKTESQFTSNASKFLKHEDRLIAYKNREMTTVISTHISPEGRCNLRCSYCSVYNRNINERIELSVIKDYVHKLKERGLRAVILTGGGEPTLYPDFIKLASWLNEQNLKLGLITNGTNLSEVDWRLFSWVRISMNLENDAYKKIIVPKEVFNCTVGGSFIYHQWQHNVDDMRNIFKILFDIGTKNLFKYVRITLDCNLDKNTRKILYDKFKLAICSSAFATKYIDENLYNNFFIQYKDLSLPKSCKCHQSYFRPYLSEVGGGTVFPCDSVVLNNDKKIFDQKYALCKAGDVLDYIDGKIKQPFEIGDCQNCAFAENNNFIEDFINGKQVNFEKAIDADHFFV